MERIKQVFYFSQKKLQQEKKKFQAIRCYVIFKRY